MKPFTQPQMDFVGWLARWNGRCVMARYDRPMFGDYGPTIRRLIKRGIVVRTCSQNGFPFLNLTPAGWRIAPLPTQEREGSQ